MTTTWILVANGSKARIFTTQKASLISKKKNGNALTLVNEFTHDASRLHTVDLVSDKLGSFQSTAGGHGSFAEKSDPKQVEQERFALEIAANLENGRKSKSYDDLILIAPANFTGLLNKHLSQHVTNLISQNIEKDYTKSTEKELFDHLQGYL